MDENISVKELKENISKYYIIDVREEDEYKQGKIENAINIPLGKLIRDEGRMIIPREKEIVVHCRSGFRGEIARKFLQERGYKVRNLIGGYMAYCSS